MMAIEPRVCKQIFLKFRRYRTTFSLMPTFLTRVKQHRKIVFLKKNGGIKQQSKIIKTPFF